MEMGLFTFAFIVKPVIESLEFFSHVHLRQWSKPYSQVRKGNMTDNTDRVRDTTLSFVHEVEGGYQL